MGTDQWWMANAVTLLHREVVLGLSPLPLGAQRNGLGNSINGGFLMFLGASQHVVGSSLLRKLSHLVVDQSS